MEYTSIFLFRSTLPLNLHPYNDMEVYLNTSGERTCKRTLALSTGAVTAVVGIADKKPAAASSAVDNDSLVRFGVTAKISFLDASYACKSTLKVSEQV